ncbi:MAG: hypothetical protein ACOX5Q_05215 [Bacillota bacterium]|jgi:hypothetical protein|nr:hypothetical protein [Candidatus Fermentithermobacillaceae bacterium]
MLRGKTYEQPDLFLKDILHKESREQESEEPALKVGHRNTRSITKCLTKGGYASMNYTVTYRRHVCKFFFIDNMSGWHFSCQPHYNEAWIQETGPLTEEETNALEAFAGIARQYGYESGKWFGRPIAAASSEEQALLDVGNLTCGTNAGTLRDVFGVMEPRFARIWAPDEERLIVLAERLRGKLHSEGMARAVEVA